MINNQVKSDLFEILKVIEDICARENLSYGLSHGTLLGAVREKGFIEWDNDIDLMMLRKDYDAFVKCCPKYLADRGMAFGIRDWFPHVRLAENPLDRSDWMVEIQVLDGIPSNGLQHRIQVKLLKTLQIMLIRGELRCLNQLSLKDKIVTRGIYWLGHLFSKEAKLKAYRRISMWGSRQNSKFLYFSTERSNFLDLYIPRNLVNKTIRMPFEGEELPVPKGWDGFLKLYFGSDYMTPKRSGFLVSH